MSNKKYKLWSPINEKELKKILSRKNFRYIMFGEDVWYIHIHKRADDSFDVSNVEYDPATSEPIKEKVYKTKDINGVLKTLRKIYGNNWKLYIHSIIC
jgi:hypothetical protein